MKHLFMKQVLKRIDQSKQFDEMRFTRDQAHEMFMEHLLFSSSLDFGHDVNNMHDAFIVQTIQLAEQMLEQQGYGRPPVPYAFILFGSGGRSEQTLWSDQDNGLIYEDSTIYEEAELEAYFVRLVDCILQGLAMLGYPPCTGNVVASNKQWRQPLSGYLEIMSRWLDEPNWENVRYLLIMADMRCIYGAQFLIDRLKDELLAYVERNPGILHDLLSNTLHHKISLGVFGRLITERYGEDAGGFDIKYGAYIPIVNSVRLLAIQAGIRSSSTLERLTSIAERGIVSDHDVAHWLRAFKIALKLRHLTPYQMESGMYTTRSKVRANQLTQELKQELKFCLKVGMDLQKYVRKKIQSQLQKERRG